MPEIIADLETTVVSPQGGEYYVQAVAEQLSSGAWEAWLEYVPLLDADEVLVTGTETTQSTREDVLRWAETLTPVYVEGAFARAVPAGGARAVARVYEAAVADAGLPIDPFDTFQLVGRDALRARLRGLTRSELLATILNYNLNPAGKSLVRLSDSQLVTFIVTAVDVQLASGRVTR